MALIFASRACSSAASWEHAVRTASPSTISLSSSPCSWLRRSGSGSDVDELHTAAILLLSPWHLVFSLERPWYVELPRIIPPSLPRARNIGRHRDDYWPGPSDGLERERSVKDRKSV